MEKPKKPRIQKWTGSDAKVYSVPISVREYHLRLEQMMDAIYTELSQLSLESEILDPSSNQSLKLIYANPTLNETGQDKNLDEESRSIAQEVFDGVA